MIRAVIFDCFGVLAGGTFQPFYRKYFAGDEEKIRRANGQLELSNRGLITYQQFVEFLAQEAKIGYQEARSFVDGSPRNEELLDYIQQELRPKYKIGMLSNAADNWIDKIFLPEDIKLFDAVVLSYAVGYAKPEARIYEITAEKVGLRLDECVFVDDLAGYVSGAQAVGMKAILYKDFVSFRQQLESLLSS